MTKRPKPKPVEGLSLRLLSKIPDQTITFAS